MNPYTEDGVLLLADISGFTIRPIDRADVAALREKFGIADG
jgi:hypothetical protein